MVPRLLLLFAFFIISCKVFQVIHIEIFKKNLCNDDFYSGGLNAHSEKSQTSRRSLAQRSLHSSKRPDRTRPAARSRYSSGDSRSVTYSSYEAYKKAGNNFR